MTCTRCQSAEATGILLALCPTCYAWLDANLDAPEAESVVVAAQEAVFAADGFAVVRAPSGKALGLRYVGKDGSC